MQLIHYYLTSQMLQLAEFHATAQVPTKPKKPSLKERKHKLLTFLQGDFYSFCLQTTFHFDEFAI